jgi:hypothetical protein
MIPSKTIESHAGDCTHPPTVQVKARRHVQLNWPSFCWSRSSNGSSLAFSSKNTSLSSQSPGIVELPQLCVSSITANEAYVVNLATVTTLSLKVQTAESRDQESSRLRLGSCSHEVASSMGSEDENPGNWIPLGGSSPSICAGCSFLAPLMIMRIVSWSVMQLAYFGTLLS